MQILKRKVTVSADTEVSTIWGVPESYGQERRLGLILAHGAGNDMHNPFLSFVQQSLVQQGVMCVKFNFPYKERGRKAPDRAPVLEATWRALLQTVRQDPQLAPEYLFLSGKSMGGRMASHLAAQGEDCAGLIFLGYPLHPYNKKSLRADHLPQIRCPMLFIEGTRDGLCDLDLLEPILARLDAPISLHRIEGGDHSFKVLKRIGRKQESVWEEIVQVIYSWLADVVSSTK